MDVTAYRLGRNNIMYQIYRATGSDMGGTKVNDAFVVFLENIIGKEVVEMFKQECPIGWLQLMCEFDKKKKGVRNIPNERLSIQLPHSMHKVHKKVIGKELEDVINSKQMTGVKFAECLIISHEIIHEIYEKAVTGIVGHMDLRMRSSDLANISHIIMVGGFSESSILQAEVKRRFGKRNISVVVPSDAGLCVLKGGVMFGHAPSVIQNRICRLTYGRRVGVRYDPRKHGKDKSRVTEWDGVEYQRGIFRAIVRKGESIKVGEVKKFLGTPVSGDQIEIANELYCTEEDDVSYCDDPGVQFVGKWLTPLEGEGLNRELETRFLFGETEIICQSRQKGQKNWVEAVYDFHVSDR